MKILIVGLGLIGASYAKGLTKKGFDVYGCDINVETNRFAVENGFVCATSTNPIDFISLVDVIILGLYPQDIIPFLQKYRPFLRNGQVITDVCGVKSPICERATILSLPAMFVGSHPMAGREKVGIAFADEKIFQGANFLICPISSTNIAAIKTVKVIAEALEFGKVSEVDPLHHDQMIAYTSQLTHAIAVCLVNSDANSDAKNFIGDSFRDLTRIAMINDNLWNQLFFENKDLLLVEINQFISELLKLKGALEDNSSEELREIFLKAKTKREAM